MQWFQGFSKKIRHWIKEFLGTELTVFLKGLLGTKFKDF